LPGTLIERNLFDLTKKPRISRSHILPLFYLLLLDSLTLLKLEKFELHLPHSDTENLSHDYTNVDKDVCNSDNNQTFSNQTSAFQISHEVSKLVQMVSGEKYEYFVRQIQPVGCDISHRLN
jgi:hypothetical protein